MECAAHDVPDAVCHNAADTCMTVSGFRPSSAKMLFLDRLECKKPKNPESRVQHRLKSSQKFKSKNKFISLLFGLFDWLLHFCLD